MTVTSSEGEFQGYVIEWANEIIREESLPFERMTQLPNVRIGRGRKEPDTVLWLDRAATRAMCEFELKTPDYSPWDPEFISAASTKADQIGAPFFVTWNVNEVVLWDRSEVHLPLLRRRKVREQAADIRDISELQDPAVRERLKETLRRLLNNLADLHRQTITKEAIFQAMPPDEAYVEMVHSYVHALSFHFAAAIRKEAEASLAFRRRLARWFKDQGWTYDPGHEGYSKAARQYAHILLNKIIFYGALRSAYAERLPAMSIGRSVKGDQVRKALTTFFQRALKIDYEPVFAPDLFDDLVFPENIAAQLRGFVTETGRYEHGALRYDVLGRVFERLVPAEERRWLGQFFTRSDLVDLIIGFCVKSPEGAFMDPACGAGTFPVRLYSRLKHFDPSLNHCAILDRLWGFDIAAFPAHLATINLYLQAPALAAFPRVERHDFFDVFPDETTFQFPMDPKGTEALKQDVAVPRCRAIVGNPPYTEQEEMELITDAIADEGSYKGHISAALDRDFGRAQVRLSKRASIYAHFFLHGAAFLEKGGRLGFVTSNSWLDTDYGRDIQRFFLERFKVVAIVESRCERWFEDAAVNTAITVVEECADADARKRNIVRFVSLTQPLTRLVPPSLDGGSDRARWAVIDDLVGAIENLTEDFRDERMTVRAVPQADLWEEGCDEEAGVYAGAKWGKYLRAPDVYFEILRRAGNKLVPLKSIAHVRRGYTTGANDFFYVKDVTGSVTDEYLRSEDWPVPLPKRLRVIEAGDGSRHLIEEDFLVPAILRVGDIDRPRFTTANLRKKLVMIDRPREALRRTWALKYIRWGEEPHAHRDRQEGRGGYDKRESCKSRRQWYNLGTRVPGHILFPMMHKRRPVIGLNDSLVQVDHNLFEVVPEDAPGVAAAGLFWGWHLLEREVIGRANLGEGVLKTEGVDIVRLRVPDPGRLSAVQKDSIAAAFAPLASRQIELIWEEVSLPDRQRLDDVMLQALGFDDASDRERIRREIYDAICALTTERMEKPQTVKQKRSSSARVDIQAMAESLVADEVDAADVRGFPADFLPAGCAAQWRAFPPGAAYVEPGHLLQEPVIRVGETEFACRSTMEALYLGYAINAGQSEVPVPEDEHVLGRAVREYGEYVRAMEKRLDAAIVERVTNKKLLRAVKQEALKLLGVVPLYV